jgi:2-oxoglutarate ferredoxin oxidoreductase subunit alpha
MDRLAHKFESIRAAVPKPEREDGPEGSIGLICCGTSRYAAGESRSQLAAEYGIETGYLRLRAFPFNQEIADFVDRHSRVYVIDQNRDAQLFTLIKIDLDPQRIGKLRSVRYYSGLPIDARSVTEEIARQEEL